MKCLLPYHTTGQFVRVVQLMPLEGTLWAFLQPTQQSGAPVPRSSLVQRCQRDQARQHFVEHLKWLSFALCTVSS